jgi:alpha-tubulin suppressor-like RCC1 family protein
MVSCGGGHTVTADTQHCVWVCGGYDQSADKQDSPPPHFVQVWPEQSARFSTSVAFVACGFAHSVLLLTTGACLAWGCNSNGQLGASAIDLPFSHLSALRLAAREFNSSLSHYTPHPPPGYLQVALAMTSACFICPDL